MGILSNLEPKRVFEIFEEMCAIPHGSANTSGQSVFRSRKKEAQIRVP